MLYMSDNGPWAPYLEQGGSAGLLRGAKARPGKVVCALPAIFRWPGTIRAAWSPASDRSSTFSRHSPVLPAPSRRAIAFSTASICPLRSGGNRRAQDRHCSITRFAFGRAECRASWSVQSTLHLPGADSAVPRQARRPPSCIHLWIRIRLPRVRAPEQHPKSLIAELRPSRGPTM